MKILYGKKGFTLLELLISISIIAVITVIGIVSYSSINRRSRDVKRKSDIEQIKSALEMFRSDNKYYPNVGNGSWTSADNLSSNLADTYMSATPSSSYYFKTKNQQIDGNYYGYCVCACLEEDTCGGGNVVLNTCEATDYSADCNYFLKNP
jgi:prepilin-type N-terminal cleavage/methylation domain-containing protein